MQLLRPSPKPILPIALSWQNSKLGHVSTVFVPQNSEPTQHSSCKESTAAFVLGCVEGQMSVMFAINRGMWGVGDALRVTVGHMIAIRRARTQQSLSLNVETLRSLLSNYPSTIHYPTSSLRLIRPGF